MGLLACVFIGWLLWLTRDVWFLLFVAILFAAVIDPFVHALERRGIGRGWSVLMIYLSILLVILGGFFLLLPPLLAQARVISYGIVDAWGMGKEMLGNVFSFLQTYGIPVNPSMAEHWLREWQQSVGSGMDQLVFALTNIVFNVVGGVMVFVLTYYLLVEEQSFHRLIQQLTPKRWRTYSVDLTRRIQIRLGEWTRTQIVLMVAIGAMTYVGLLILGVPYALLLSVLAGAMELIPYAGPILSTIPIVFIALTISPAKALAAFILCIIIQQLENNVLIPQVMARSVGLNPVVSIVSLMLGYTLGGVIGTLIAIPVATAVMVWLDDLFAMGV